MTDKNISKTNIIGKKCKEIFLPLNLPELRELRHIGIDLAGISKLKPPYQMYRSSGHRHILVCTTKGSGKWNMTGHSEEILPNSAWLFPAGFEYNYHINDSIWDIHWFHFKPEVAPELKGSFPKKLNIDIVGLKASMQSLLREELQSLPGKSPILTQYAKLSLMLLRRALGLGEEHHIDEIELELSRLWNKVGENLKHNWSIQEMAESMHLSCGHFHRIVLNKYGDSPKKIVTDMKMEQAKMLLKRTSYPLYSIAESIGYQTAFAFSKAFKKNVGISPREYRKKNTS